MTHDAVSVQLCRSAGLSEANTDALLTRLKGAKHHDVHDNNSVLVAFAPPEKKVRPLAYDPCSGFLLDKLKPPVFAEQYRVDHPGNVWFHNPYTGAKRPLAEIAADKFGYELSGDSLEQIDQERRAARALDVQEGGSHYKNMAIQPIEFIFKNGIGYAEGNVIKYVTRWRNKNGVEDLKKARHYLDLLIESESQP